MRRRQRSISTPIVLTSIAGALGVTLLVAWTVVFVTSASFRSQLWLMVLGLVSLVTLVTVLLVFGIVLVREILEGRRQTTFVDSVTHELKSPLASLRLCLETLNREDLSGEQRQRVRGMMSDDVERLATFIEDLLVAARLTAGAGGLATRDLNLRQVVERSLSRVRRRHGLGEDTILARGNLDAVVTTDDNALETILVNLLDNAVKYSDDANGVAIEVDTSTPGELRITVSDHGIGIPRHLLKRVFDRFFRVGHENVRKRRGTGLGLFVAATAARLLGGRIVAESAGPGRGTQMHVSLPTTHEPGQTQTQTPELDETDPAREGA